MLDLKSGFSYRKIVWRLGSCPSMITREIGKIKGQKDYRYQLKDSCLDFTCHKKISSHVYQDKAQSGKLFRQRVKLKMIAIFF